jgi:protein gp37
VTKIEWVRNAAGELGKTWNPIVGYTVLSPGCTNCYAMKMAARIEAMGSGPHYAGTTEKVNGRAVWTGKLARAEGHVWSAPLMKRKPTVYFVNSMGDLFHEDCPDEWILDALTVMAGASNHTFQVLTKRAARMREFMSRPDLLEDIYANWYGYCSTPAEVEAWPLPNVWLGVSAERQKEADERIPHLLATPAAVRFVSLEPLLGPIDLERVAYQKDEVGAIDERWTDALRGATTLWHPGRRGGWGGVAAAALDWVIVGGESGPDARPMHPDWARSIRDQCTAAGVAFFFKQHGTYEVTVAAEDYQDYAAYDADEVDLRQQATSCKVIWPDGRVLTPKASRKWWAEQDFESEGDTVELSGCPVVVHSVGKKAAGRLLDGREWNEMPAIAREPGTKREAAIVKAREREEKVST